MQYRLSLLPPRMAEGPQGTEQVAVPDARRS